MYADSYIHGGGNADDEIDRQIRNAPIHEAGARLMYEVTSVDRKHAQEQAARYKRTIPVPKEAWERMLKEGRVDAAPIIKILEAVCRASLDEDLHRGKIDVGRLANSLGKKIRDFRMG